MATKSELVIVGCGFLGRAICRSKQERFSISAIVRTQKSAAELREIGVPAEVLDINQPGGQLSEQTSTNRFVLFCVPPSGLQRDADTVRTFVQSLVREEISKAILVSSTAVYAESNGECVTAETDPHPATERAKKLLDIESAWAEGGEQFAIVRLAGLYGPGRVIGKQKLLASEPLSGNPEQWLNLIHIDDAAELVVECLTKPTHHIELGSDMNPIKRREYYEYVSEQIGSASPIFSESKKSASLGKRCNSGATYERIAWSPRYPHFHEGINQSLGNK